MRFFEAVRSAYLQRAKAAPSRYRVIDAGQALNAVQCDVEALILSCWCASMTDVLPWQVDLWRQLAGAPSMRMPTCCMVPPASANGCWPSS